MLHKEKLNLHFVFYEQLSHNFGEELQKLLDYLELELSVQTRVKHLNKGKYGKWTQKLGDDQKELAEERAGALMQMLNYPINEQQLDKLPYIPQTIHHQKLLDILTELDWTQLFT